MAGALTFEEVQRAGSHVLCAMLEHRQVLAIELDELIVLPFGAPAVINLVKFLKNLLRQFVALIKLNAVVLIRLDDLVVFGLGGLFNEI